MLSAGPDAFHFSPSQNIRLKRASRIGNEYYRHAGSTRSQSRRVSTEATMRTVKIRSRETDFARMMLEMRTWLDQHRFEPTKFTYEQDREVIVISVEFHRDNDAEAFKNCFDSQQPRLDFALRNEFVSLSG